MGAGAARSLLVLLAGVAACATPISTSRDWDPAADFGALHTWAWLEASEAQWQAPAIPFDSLLDARIREAVESGLGDRGFRHVESGQPDFLVAYHAAVATQLEARTLYRGSAASRHWGASTWSDTQIRQFQQGSLLLDVLDPVTGNLLWRGVASARLRSGLSPQQRTELVNRAVQTLLDPFPPE